MGEMEWGNDEEDDDSHWRRVEWPEDSVCHEDSGITAAHGEDVKTLFIIFKFSKFSVLGLLLSSIVDDEKDAILSWATQRNSDEQMITNDDTPGVAHAFADHHLALHVSLLYLHYAHTFTEWIKSTFIGLV